MEGLYEPSKDDLSPFKVGVHQGFMSDEINQLYFSKDSMEIEDCFTENQIFSMGSPFQASMAALGSPKGMRSLSPKERYSQDVQQDQIPLCSFQN